MKYFVLSSVRSLSHEGGLLLVLMRMKLTCYLIHRALIYLISQKIEKSTFAVLCALSELLIHVYSFRLLFTYVAISLIRLKKQTSSVASI